MISGADKELKKLMRRLKELGYDVSHTRNNHYSITHANAPGVRVITGHRLGERHALLNIIKTVRRTFPNIPSPE